MTYAQTAELLVDRIVALIPSHPEILTMDEPWPLFKIAEFKCDDLQPTYAQACAALAEAKARQSKEM